MTSWKTTLAGIGALLGSLAAAIKLFLAGDLVSAISTLVAGVSAGIGLIHARDNNVTSEQAGAK
jgi:hypothetical protein